MKSDGISQVLFVQVLLRFRPSRTRSISKSFSRSGPGQEGTAEGVCATVERSGKSVAKCRIATRGLGTCIANSCNTVVYD